MRNILALLLLVVVLGGCVAGQRTRVNARHRGSHGDPSWNVNVYDRRPR